MSCSWPAVPLRLTLQSDGHRKRLVASRSQSLTLCRSTGLAPAQSSLFCVQEVSTRTSLKEGMSLYGLTNSELFWDKLSDTKMLMAWSSTCVVCSFRGTASLNNAVSDLQVSSHLPRMRF